ncbi:isochorismate synthase [Brenneria tiliae]|uniref:isochorismate synthase n=1 Tax=Brenneria tiliae TaxID=2914984 RepID=UPI002014D1C8|nr:isochorismate synthase [Brenneria tiliae]MCL2897936.1 isochorismate synthase [Brenneria tiliae]MCL2902017.1 isochorismate synthase [Brenneria tiliae]
MIRDNITQEEKSGWRPDSGFFFSSPFRSLYTQGRFMSLATPASDGFDAEGEFQRTLQQAFAHARAAGIAEPVLVGAIPFDATRPSSLFIPRQSHWFRRSDLTTPLLSDCPSLPDIVTATPRPEREVFVDLVSQAVNATREGNIAKVVLSRLLDIELGAPVDHRALLARMLAREPDAYHFYVPLDDGALLGASPELLLRKSGRHLHSTPLAGSAARATDPQADRNVGQRLLDSAKDGYEHQVVINEMRRVLIPRCRQLHIPDTPQLLSTATLWHLATAISGETANETDNALSLASLLHPTPALCGYPTEAARSLIASLEPFDRGLFGGIVGWCDAQGNGEWVVTIRCGEVRENRVTLFAGAGIVPDSQPVSEWNETGVKLSTMLNAFGITNDRECVA